MVCELADWAFLEALGLPVTGDVLREYADAAADIVYGYCGHTFGLAARVWHDGAGGATDATVAIANNELTLAIIGGGYEGAVTMALENYTLSELAEFVDNLEIGWHVRVVCDGEQPSVNLKDMSAVSALGEGNRAALCLKQWTEICTGGETRIQLEYPARRIVSVVEDGVTLTEGTHFWLRRGRWLVRGQSAGSGYCCVGRWSARCWNNITVTYVPWWIGNVPSVVAQVLADITRYLATETGYESEKLGDYSYTRGEGGVSTYLARLAGLAVGVGNYGGGTAGGLL